MAFKKAQRRALPARIALIGPPGAGKTYTALLWAKVLAGPTGKIAVIDTENRTASKYSGYVADFDVEELESFAPERYVEAIESAARESYDVLIIDSATHAWAGKDGILEQKDKKAGANSFDAWRTLTPQHNRLVDAMLRFPGHLIVTMRAKMAYEVDKDEKGKTSIRKLGLAPVQREGLEYEFDVVMDVLEHGAECKISKSRCPALAGQTFNKPGPGVAQQILDWLNDGITDPRAMLSATARSIADAYDAAQDSAAIGLALASLKSAWPKLTKSDRVALEAAASRAKARVAENARILAEEAEAAKADAAPSEASPPPDDDNPGPPPDDEDQPAAGDLFQ